MCVSWNRRAGVWHAYLGGKLKLEGSDLATRHSIRPGGTLILGQEQVRQILAVVTGCQTVVGQDEQLLVFTQHVKVTIKTKQIRNTPFCLSFPLPFTAFFIPLLLNSSVLILSLDLVGLKVILCSMFYVVWGCAFKLWTDNNKQNDKETHVSRDVSFCIFTLRILWAGTYYILVSQAVSGTIFLNIRI